MVVVSYNHQYSGVITNLIDTLKGLKSYYLQIWVDGTEIPFTADDLDKIEFLEESIKITNNSDSTITWILYGIIMSFKVTRDVTY